MSTTIEVTHNPAASRFETTVDGLLCEATYRREGEVLLMHHTGVPRALEGRGIAAQLVAAAFAHARANGLRIQPLCSYVRGWAARHPEVSDLLA
ncbi:MAG: GNAT family N-acetyltransferase [Burkholderiaceae bacterium]